MTGFVLVGRAAPRGTLYFQRVRALKNSVTVTSVLRLIPMDNSFILLFPRVPHHQNTNETMDETHPTTHRFMFAIS